MKSTKSHETPPALRSGQRRACLLLAGLLGLTGWTEPDPARAAVGPVPPYSSQVVRTWNLHTIAAITTDDGYADPLQATRTLAMVHVAMHDAVNAVLPFFESYAFDGRDAAADPEAAAAAAAHGVLLRLFPNHESQLDAWLLASTGTSSPTWAGTG